MTYHTNPSVLDRRIVPHNYIDSLESTTSIVSKNRHHPTLRKGHKTPLPKREPLYCGSFLDRTHRATLVPALVIRIPGYPNTDPLIYYYREKKYKPRNQPSKTLGTSLLLSPKPQQVCHSFLSHYNINIIFWIYMNSYWLNLFI